MWKLRWTKDFDHGIRSLIFWNMMGIYHLAISKFGMVVAMKKLNIYAYKRLMSPMDTLLKMLIFFASVQMHALENMVWKDGERFQVIWEETIEERGHAFVAEVFKIFKTLWRYWHGLGQCAMGHSSRCRSMTNFSSRNKFRNLEQQNLRPKFWDTISW